MLKRIVSALCVAVLAAAWPAGAQIPYKRGQDVQPAFEGWTRNADGSYSLLFAYFNRNYEEVLDIPIGPDNNMQPGGPDRGQPTHFDVRRQRLVFSVDVPASWTRNDKLVWTLTSHGQTNTAKGWLLPEWELTPQVISQDLGGGNGYGNEANRPPVIVKGSEPQTISQSDSAQLSVTVNDDGLPKPPEEGPRRPSGVRVRWVHYRGPGVVAFKSAASAPNRAYPLTVTTSATFSAPGEYVVRAYALDGAAQATFDAQVTVKP